PDLSAFTQLLQVDDATVRKVLKSWGPGKYDAELNLDGKAFRPDGKPAATLNPPAYGLAGVNNHTWTGAWGTVTYWNAYVGNLHTAQEIGIDEFQAMRSPDGRYRTAPLRALWDMKKSHKGGFYHDGRFATLLDVVNHYDRHFGLRLSEQEKADLIEYLKSI